VRLVLAVAIVLSGCASGAEFAPPQAPWGRAHFDETEPNDDVAEPLGELRIGHSIGGSADGCGRDGLWDGADLDRLSFTVPSGRARLYRLRMDGGDFDLAIRGDGIEIDAGRPGVDDETVTLSLDPDLAWEFAVLCWAGDGDAMWRIDIEDGE
jgi:hypothetical protein